MLGETAAAVSRDMKAAGRALAKLAGWKEQPAVTALILFGLANALLPAPRDGSEQEQEQEKLQCSSMDDTQAIHEELPVKDPLVTAFLTFRITSKNLATFLPWYASGDPVNISGWPIDGGEWGSHPAFVVADSEWHAVAARREGVNRRVGKGISRANSLF